MTVEPDPGPYDVQLAIRRLRRERTRAPGRPLDLECVRIADKLAGHMRRNHYPDDPETARTAGEALIIAVASLSVLCEPEIPSQVILNIAAYAGQQLTEEPT